MSGTRSGGMKTAQTNKDKYGADYYKRISRLGGQKGHTGGFYADRELASRAGRKGGTISRRGSVKPFIVDDSEFGEGFFEPTWRQKMLNKIRSM